MGEWHVFIAIKIRRAYNMNTMTISLPFKYNFGLIYLFVWFFGIFVYFILLLPALKIHIPPKHRSTPPNQCTTTLLLPNEESGGGEWRDRQVNSGIIFCWNLAQPSWKYVFHWLYTACVPIKWMPTFLAHSPFSKKNIALWKGSGTNASHISYKNVFWNILFKRFGARSCMGARAANKTLSHTHKQISVGDTF